MKRSGLRALGLSSIPLLLAACGDAPPAKVAEPVTTATPPATATAIATVVAAVAKPYVPKPVRFENPGGMWMPAQMGAHAAKLKELGLAIDPAQLTDPTSKLLSSVVSLGGCSASFVSASGLVITNHHCAIGALQFNSSKESNLLKNGYYAKTRADEKSNGPTFRVFVTQKVTDITAKILPAAGPGSDLQRFKTLEANQKLAVSACEQGRAGIRCTVSGFYEGAAYYLIEQLEIRDVRLVFAPPEGVGNYGGETDNWRWPRHTGDFSIFRAYVGPDGKPADFSPNNVPYAPPNHLALASKGLEEGDLVMVAGYPGRTYSLKTKAEVDDAIGWSYPKRQKLCEDFLARLAEVGKTDETAAIRANPLVRRYGNALTNIKGQLEGLVKDGLAAQKGNNEQKLATFIDADKARKAQFGTVLPEIAKAFKTLEATRDQDFALRSEFLVPRLVNAAATIVRMAEERPKADKDRDPNYQERNWAQLDQSLKSLDQQYNKAVDVGLLALAIERAQQSGKTPALLAALRVTALQATKYAGKEPTATELATALYATTTLGDGAQRTALMQKSTAELRKSTDPLIQVALQHRPLLAAAELREQTLAGRLTTLKPAYIQALRALEGKEIAPDANSTLRITYGTVRGYKPSPSAAVNVPFTLLSEVIKKHTGGPEFDVPLVLREAFAAKKFGNYTHPDFAEVPVDFLSDLHITGGNSGSATINAKGEITGLVFDGNYEALASDWLFKPETTRSIHVDIRYLMWLLDAVFNADDLVKELGGTPNVN
jgi:Peptidase S46